MRIPGIHFRQDIISIYGLAVVLIISCPVLFPVGCEQGVESNTVPQHIAAQNIENSSVKSADRSVITIDLQLSDLSAS